jgi:NTP pyrophosphatase (non-canonical NTP hydrolase)
MVNSNTVGTFINSVAGDKRKAKDVAGRLVEEVTELALATGLSGAQILAHVTDSLYNQSIKQGKKIGKTVFPSEVTDSASNIPEECADVSLVLKDLAYVANVNISDEEDKKWAKFTKKTLRVSDVGTVYAVKPHIIKD